MRLSLVATLIQRTGKIEVSWNAPDKSIWSGILQNVKLLDKRWYNPERRVWFCENSKANRDKLKSWHFELRGFAEAETTSIAQEEWEPPWNNIRLKFDQVPEGMFGYQKDHLRMMIHTQGRGLNCDEPGTGKTIQALGWMEYAQLYPTLIVTTAPTKRQWAKQFSKWCKGEAVQILYGQTPHELAPITTIINWEILAHWGGRFTVNSLGHERFVFDGPLSRVEWKCMVADEFHLHIGNSSSKRTKAFRALGKTIPSIQPLSGTPIRSKPDQFYPILNILAPARFPNQQSFRNRYCDPKSNGFGVMYKGATNMDELHEIIRDLMLRRLMLDVNPEMPPVLPVVVPLEVPKNSTDMVDLDDIMFGARPDQALRLAGRSAFEIKKDEVVNWVESFLGESNEKFLLFVWHRDAVEYLAKKLKKYKPLLKYGKMTESQGEEAKNKFIKDPSRQLMIANISSGGTGIDGLQDVCHSVGFAEFADTPTDMEQAIRRLWRTGQSSCVNVYYLVVPDSVDEDQAEILDERAQTMATLLDGQQLEETDMLTELIKRKKARKGL